MHLSRRTCHRIPPRLRRAFVAMYQLNEDLLPDAPGAVETNYGEAAAMEERSQKPSEYSKDVPTAPVPNL